MANYVKIPTNIPQSVKFNFDTPMERENKFKPGEKQYSYGVQWLVDEQWIEAYLTATPILNDKLQGCSPLRGKTLKILKYEDGQKKLWKILDTEGNDITPNWNSSSKQETNNDSPKPDTDQIKKLNENIQKLVFKIQEMDKDIKGLKACLTPEQLDCFELGKEDGAFEKNIGEKPADYPEINVDEIPFGN